MKTRNGFVTNSSSSSFVVVMKKPVSDKELEEKITGIFRLDTQHPLYGMSRSIVREFLGSMRYEEPLTKDDLEWLIGEYGPPEECEYTELLEKYGNIVLGSFESDGDMTEQWLCENDLNYEDDDIIIKHDGGY